MMTAEQELEVMDVVADRVTKHFIAKHGDNVPLTVYQASGYLNVSIGTIKANYPPCDVTGKGGSLRWYKSDLDAGLASRKVKA